MNTASIVLHHISDRKSNLSIEMENKVDESYRPYTWRAWFIPRFSSLIYMTLLVYWICTEQNGFSNFIPSLITPSQDTTANGYLGYHALGLSIWAVFSNQESIMAYAIPLCCCKCGTYQSRKYVHVLAQVVGLLTGIGGMVAIIWYKQSSVSMSVQGTTFTILDNSFYVPYSPHAWMGLAFFGLWVIQCVGRLIPQFQLSYHRFVGRALYLTGLGCCCLGIQQQQTRQLVSALSMITNSTQTNQIVTNWWFSQPSLAVLLLAVTGTATFFYGLL